MTKGLYRQNHAVSAPLRSGAHRHTGSLGRCSSSRASLCFDVLLELGFQMQGSVDIDVGPQVVPGSTVAAVTYRQRAVCRCAGAVAVSCPRRPQASRRIDPREIPPRHRHQGARSSVVGESVCLEVYFKAACGLCPVRALVACTVDDGRYHPLMCSCGAVSIFSIS